VPSHPALDAATFDGLVDDVRVYQRTLAASEISSLATPAGWRPDDQITQGLVRMTICHQIVM
jgi:hypothetical protein